jgi:hypothetical protein
MVNRINNNLPPFLVKSEDTSKSNLFSVSSVNQGVRLSSYGYSDSTAITDPISLRSGKSLFDSIESPTDLINIIDLGKGLNDSTNPIIDLLNYNIIKSFTHGIDPITDNLIYNIAKVTSDSAITSDLINTLNFDKILNDIINVSERLGLSKSKILDSAGTAETLDLLGIDDGITYGLSKIFNDSVNATEILQSLYAVGRQPLDSSSASDINTISFGKNSFDSSTITESHIYTLDKILADSSLISESLVNSLLKSFTDSESATDFVSLEPGKIFFDSIESPTDLINTFAVVKNLNDSINPVEVLNYNIDKEIQNEILSPIDLLARDFLKTLADSSFISDLPQLNLNKPNFADDSVNVNDAGLISVQDYFLEIYVSDLQPYVEKSNTTF